MVMITALAAALWRVVTVITPSLSMASMALSKMFKNTCCNCEASLVMHGRVLS